MQEYLDLGHIKSIDLVRDDEQSPAYYLPHYCVLRSASQTTKLRVVFDGSCQSSTSITLNDFNDGPNGATGPNIDSFKI